VRGREVTYRPIGSIPMPGGNGSRDGGDPRAATRPRERAPRLVRYTPRVPSRSILESLAYVNWALLFSLSLGSLATVVLLRWRTDASRGYLAFAAACAALLAGFTYLLDGGLPAPESLAIHAATPALEAVRRGGLAVLTVLAAAEVVARLRSARRPWFGLAGIGSGVVVALAAGLGWGAPTWPGLAIAAQLLVLAAATGGVLAAMILGHWYLVTPRLSEGPLILAARALTAVVVLQIVLFGAWTALGIGTYGPFAVLTGGEAIFVWLRLVVSLVFPLVLTMMAVRTARTRSMESATGLLYIDTAAIFAGTIVAAALLFGAGVIV
jgi:heme exporter protein D